MIEGYRVVEIDGKKSITILYDGKLYSKTESDPNFNEICVAVLAKNYELAAELCDTESSIRESLSESALSDRISVENGRVHLDGELCDDTITELIVDMKREGKDYTALANFYAHLSENPIHHSRNRMFDWLRASGSFSLDGDGYIIGYKGLNSEFKSHRSGPGYVNGQPYYGQLDNSPGNVLSIDEVEMDPSVGCSYGLHVGTYDYASNWANGGKVVSVRVNPADVVSVPTDCADAKMRCREYEVIEEVNAPYNERIV